MALTRQQILDADDRQTIMLDVPEWGGFVKLRTIDGTERGRLEYDVQGPTGKSATSFAALKARVVALTVVDDDGAQLFTPADIPLLNAKSGAAIDRVFEAACKLNRLRPSDIEDLTKNSGGDQTADLS